MKKINFGSFPLIDIDPNERQCIDKYMIKNFADLLQINTFNNTMKKEMNFITPSYLSELQNTQYNFTDNKDDRNHNNIQVIKNAFKGLGEIYRGIQNDPFYNKKINFPIYIENTTHRKEKNKSITDINTSVEYDFLVLNNSLIDNDIIDETHYDDRITIVMLFLIMQLVPGIPAANITRSNKGNELRIIVAKFIELSDKYDKDPINFYIDIVKIAGQSKRNTNKLGTISSPMNALEKDKKFINISKQLNHLFNSSMDGGDIKDANYLLNQVQQKEISAFFDAENQEINGQKIPNDDYKNNPLFREFSQQKVFKYNKILSLYDYFLTFNSLNKPIFEDSSTKLDNITLSSENSTDINIDREQILIILEQQFAIFIKNLHECLENKMFNLSPNGSGEDRMHSSNGVGLYENIQLNKKELIEEASGTSDKVKKRALNKQLSKITSSMDMLNDEINFQVTSIEKIITSSNAVIPNIPDFINTLIANPYSNTFLNIQGLDSNDIHNITYNVKNIVQNRNKLNTLLLQKNDIEDKLGKLEIALLEKVELFDDSAIQVLSNTYKELYSELQDYFYGDINDELLEVINLSNSRDINIGRMENFKEEVNYSTNSIYNTKFAKQFGRVSIAELKVTMMDEFMRTRGLDDNIYEYDDKLDTQKIQENVFDYCVDKNFRNYIIIPILRKLKSFVRKTNTDYVKKEFSNISFLTRLTKKSNNFKTYILSEDVLVKLYDITLYVESQKYIHGVLNTPPSKVSNPKNKIRMILKRLGLMDNPVFIVGRGYVTVQMPDFMSISGDSLFNSIPFAKLEEICKIDWRKDIQKSEYMFKKKYGKSEDNQKIKVNLSTGLKGTHSWSIIKSDIENELNSLEVSLKTAKSSKKPKEVEKIEAKLKKLKEEKKVLENIAKEKAKEQSDNIKSGIQFTSKRNNYPEPEKDDDNKFDYDSNNNRFNNNNNTINYQQNMSNRINDYGQDKDKWSNNNFAPKPRY